jgi:hypothetical protein
MAPSHARRLLFALGAACGFCLFLGFVAAVILALASNSGAGWQKRHQLTKGDV